MENVFALTSLTLYKEKGKLWTAEFLFPSLEKFAFTGLGAIC